MAKIITDNKHYTDIAAAIREKTGAVTEYKPEEMAAAVLAMETEKELVLEDVYIEPSDETQVVKPSKGYDAIGSVTVYPAEQDLQLEDVYITPTEEEQTVYPSDGYDAIGSVTVGAAEGGGAMAIPEQYQTYVEQAQNIYDGDYTDLAIADNGKYGSVMFLTSDFAITEYDSATTNYKAIGIVFVTCVKATGAWDGGVDHTTTPSTGSRFISNWVYCSRYVTYNGEVLFPVGYGVGGGITSYATKGGKKMVGTLSTVYFTVESVTGELVE